MVTHNFYCWKPHMRWREEDFKRSSWRSQSRRTVKNGRESRGTRNQEWLCWRRLAAIYQSVKLHEREYSQLVNGCPLESPPVEGEWPVVSDPSSWKQDRSMVMSPETKIDCAGGRQQQCTQSTDYKRRVTRQKYIGHGSCGALKQEWLCWRGSLAINQTGYKRDR
jgi:hypothetical protein